MFKGTNKIWKGLALLLVLCMLPTVALADEAATVEIEVAKADETATPATVTVTAEIGKKDTDITILAYRSATKVESGKPDMPAVDTVGDVKGLKDSVVYIDQETATDAGDTETAGKHTFTFIPRNVTGVGKYINIFVGGENVNETAFKQITLANAAPVVKAPAALYNTCDVELAIVKSSESWTDAATEAWYADIASLTVGSGEPLEKNVDYSLKADKTAIVINNSEVQGTEISAIKIVGTEYADVDVTFEKTPLTWEAKVPGTIKSVVVAPESKIDPVTATLTLEDSTVSVCQGWVSAITPSAVTYAVDSDEFSGTFTAEQVTIDDNTVEVKLPTVAEGTKNYKIQIAVDGYTAVATEAIAVTSPTTDAWTNFEKPEVTYSKETAAEGESFTSYEGSDEDEKAAMYGAASVTLPATGANDTTYTWKLDTVDKTGETVVLARPASEGDTPDTATYDFELTISKGGYTSVVETVTFTVNKCGIAGVTVSVSPVFNAKAEANAVLAKDATITLSSADKEYPVVWNASEKVFKAEKVVAGTYTIKIERPGFFVATAEIEVTKQGTITGDLPTLVAGNVNGDGTINILDVSAAIGHWDTNAIVADVNGDETVNILDVSTIIGNWDATGVGLGAN